MSEMGEFWKDYRDDQKDRRQKRLPEKTKEIYDLEQFGYVIEIKTEYQFRVNGAVDLFPIHKRYHDLRSNRRGNYRNLKTFIKSILQPK